MSIQKLYILTQTYPDGTGEETFVGPESLRLEKDFTVVCVPLELRCKNGAAFLGQNLVAAARCFFAKSFYRQLAQDFKGGKGAIKRLAYTFFVAQRANRYAAFLEKNVFVKGESAIVYSYWYNEICLGALWLKRKYPLYKFVTRTHGYDLFDFRSPSGAQPFKEYMDNKLDRVFFVSNQGKEYYLDRYARADGEKYEVCYLGTPQETRPSTAIKKELCLVSCSYVIPLKRIEIIIEALALLKDIPVKWVHVGGGEGLEDMIKTAQKVLCGKDNVSFEFAGHIDNAEYMKRLEKGEFDAFITTSKTEGLPVTLMEAQSVGLFSIATAVGGIPEIVTEENGTLLPQDPTPQQAAQAITDYYRLSQKEKQEKSDKAYNSWKTKFDAGANSDAFAQTLLKL
ncbi:MAG: glycosyltransferase [Oscillospiraceae bacterium]